MNNIINKYYDIIEKLDSLVLKSDIIEQLQHEYYSENKSFLSEYPSVIIYLTYRLKDCKDEKYYKVLYSKIEYYLRKLVTSIKENSTNNISLCYGFTGLVYTLNFLVQQCKEFSSLLDTFETILLTLTKDRLSKIKKSSFVKEEYIDVIQGVSSVAKYLLHKEKLDYDQELLLREVLDYLVIVLNKRPTIYPNFMPTKELKQKYPDGYINLGVAHGILGPMSVLASGYKKFNEPKYLTSVENGLRYYGIASQTNETGQIIGWNSRISTKIESENVEINLSWCYGNLGIARVLYNISRMMDNHKLERTTIDIFRLSASYLDCVNILNSGVCHGRSGIMLLYNLMYLDTGEEQFKNISEHLFCDIINESSDSEYIFIERDIYFRGIIYDKLIEYIDFGLLGGTVGIALALIGQKTENTYPLDEMLFMQ